MGAIDWWRNKPRRDAARSLLQQEVDLNLNLLKEWWDELKPRKDEDEIHWVDKVVYAREFADAALPEFSRGAYLNRQSSLSLYVRGDPFKRLVQFYANLAKVEEIHEELRRALEKDVMLRRTAEGQPASRGDISPRYDEFLGIAAQSWFHAANLIEQALSQGNPLGKRAYSTFPPIRKSKILIVKRGGGR